MTIAARNPNPSACAAAIPTLAFEGNTVKDNAAAPKNTAMGAAVAAACPGLGALYTNCFPPKHPSSCQPSHLLCLPDKTFRVVAPHLS